MTYITAKEVSEKWCVSTRRINVLCKEGRIPGAIKKSNLWLIPENAKKPEDGRTATIKNQLSPVVLTYNPTYFDNKSFSPAAEDKYICEIQEKFFQGQLLEAYEEVNKALVLFTEIRYKYLFYFLKLIICADLGKIDEYKDIVNKLCSLSNNSDTFAIERQLFYYYLGKEDCFDGYMLNIELLDEIMPLISLISTKNTINAILQNEKK